MPPRRAGGAACFSRRRAHPPPGPPIPARPRRREPGRVPRCRPGGVVSGWCPLHSRMPAPKLRCRRPRRSRATHLAERPLRSEPDFRRAEPGWNTRGSTPSSASIPARKPRRNNGRWAFWPPDQNPQFLGGFGIAHLGLAGGGLVRQGFETGCSDRARRASRFRSARCDFWPRRSGGREARGPPSRPPPACRPCFRRSRWMRSTMSASCSSAPDSRRSDNWGCGKSRFSGARLSWESASTGTSSSFASALRDRLISAISRFRFSKRRVPGSAPRMSWR